PLLYTHLAAYYTPVCFGVSTERERERERCQPSSAEVGLGSVSVILRSIHPSRLRFLSLSSSSLHQSYIENGRHRGHSAPRL
ncbi:unnamed protein product, partial [Ilex paraguariensis]